MNYDCPRITLIVLVSALAIVLSLLGDNSPEPSVAAGAEPDSNSAVSLLLESYVAGLDRPTGIANAGDMRLFVLEKAGQIRIIDEDGRLLATPFLDIQDKVDSSGLEMGLLGMAFHPEYRQNGYFYVNYTNSTGGVRRSRISRFSVSADANAAVADSEKVLLTVDQPYPNHNAGNIAFGPDGYLYIPLGDGGSGGDPDNHAQSDQRLLGKISRIDVDGQSGTPADCNDQGTGDYTVPAGNPIVDGPGGDCDEIWASGLRNPWQSTFDLETGDFYIADVGQSSVEEVNFQLASSIGGENYGWHCYEGSQPYEPNDCPSPESLTFPIFEYSHSDPYDGCSVTGGYVYRGQRFQALYGRYLLTDYCSGRFWDLLRLPDESWQATVHLPAEVGSTAGNAAFGQRCDGELFVANVEQGKVFYLTGQASPVLSQRRSERDGLVDLNPTAYLPLISRTRCLPVP